MQSVLCEDLLYTDLTNKFCCLQIGYKQGRISDKQIDIVIVVYEVQVANSGKHEIVRTIKSLIETKHIFVFNLFTITELIIKR